MIITISREFGSGGRELERKIHAVDEERKKHRAFYAADRWGANENFHLCINTSELEIKKLVPVLAEYVGLWAEMRKAA